MIFRVDGAIWGDSGLLVASDRQDRHKHGNLSRACVIGSALCVALALAWFIGAVAWPVWCTRQYLAEIATTLSPYRTTPVSQLKDEVQAMGGGAVARPRLMQYLGMPKAIAPNKWIALKLLGCAGAESMPVVLEQASSRELYVRYAVVEALGNLGSAETIESILAALKDDDPKMCLIAVEALAKIRHPDAVAPLMTSLRSEKQEVADAAKHALSAIVDSWLEPLVDAYQSKGKGQCQLDVPRRLSISRDPRQVEFLGEVLSNSQQWSVRVEAVFALRCFDTSRSNAILLAALADKNETVRMAAIITTSEVLPPGAEEALEKCTRDDSEKARQAAREALDKIKKAQQEKQAEDTDPPGEEMQAWKEQLFTKTTVIWIRHDEDTTYKIQMLDDKPGLSGESKKITEAIKHLAKIKKAKRDGFQVLLWLQGKMTDAERAELYEGFLQIGAMRFLEQTVPGKKTLVTLTKKDGKLLVDRKPDE